MVALAFPLRTVPGDASAAKAALIATKDAAVAGDTDAARTQVAVAQGHVEALQEATDGLGVTVWTWVPVAGGPVRDVRHLADALADLTEVAATGVETWDSLNDSESPLMRGKVVNLKALRQVADEARTIDALLASATNSLDAVADQRLIGGSRFAAARNEARAVTRPVARTVDGAIPVLERLPVMLGANSRQDYLIAMLNQSEQRHSGGAALSMATLSARNGRIVLGDPIDAASDSETFERLNWEPVKGNIFHRADSTIAGATYAPNWSISGQETARAWQELNGERIDGLIAVDLTTLAALLEVTGPIEDSGFGTITSANLLSEVIGNYDAYEDDIEGRKALNRALVPLFSDVIFDSTQMTDKLRSLRASAQGRHFAVWMRDEQTQELVADAGLSGDLSRTQRDYLTVSNQNTNVAKSDFWLRRAVSTRVRVAADGSAKVRVSVELHNDSPPWPFTEPDPEGNSFVTRWNGMSQAVFLPRQATDVRTWLGGTREADPWVSRFFGHKVVRSNIMLAPQARESYVLEYTVPHAAKVGRGGRLAYRLTMDPHTLVQPESRRVVVSFPASMGVTRVPEGWTLSGNTARLVLQDLAKTEEFTVTAAP